MITKTDAIVLKSMRYRDTSKIVTFYSRRYGKIKGIAKGARDTKSKFGGALEPISLVSLVLYKKEHREIQFISQCDFVKRYRSIHTNISKIAVGMAILELLQKLTHDEEENIPLFNLVASTLDVLDEADRNGMNLLRAFQLRLGHIFGYGVSLDRCISCSRSVEEMKEEEGLFFIAPKGALRCEECAAKEHLSSAAVKLTVGGVRMLQRFSADPLESLTSIDVAERTGNEIDETLRLYLQYHFEGMKPLRSLEVLQ